MHKIYCILLFAACFCILIDCQGGGGGRGRSSGGGSRSRSRSSSRSSYSSSYSSRSSSTYGSKGGSTDFFWICFFIGICIAIGVSIYLCDDCRQGQPERQPCKDNQTFVNLNSKRRKQEVHQTHSEEHMESLMNSYHCSVFRNGIWESRYYQYREWHGPYESLLSFDPQTMNVTGSGWDDVGKFTVFGYYSDETRRMGLTKTYQGGTGDLNENLGHKVVIQVMENLMKVLEGKWYVQTSEFQGEDKFEMKFIREREFEAETPATTCSTSAENADMHLNKSSQLFIESEK